MSFIKVHSVSETPEGKRSMIPCLINVKDIRVIEGKALYLGYEPPEGANSTVILHGYDGGGP